MAVARGCATASSGSRITWFLKHLYAHMFLCNWCGYCSFEIWRIFFLISRLCLNVRKCSVDFSLHFRNVCSWAHKGWVNQEFIFSSFDSSLGSMKCLTLTCDKLLFCLNSRQWFVVMQLPPMSPGCQSVSFVDVMCLFYSGFFIPLQISCLWLSRSLIKCFSSPVNSSLQVLCFQKNCKV